VANSDKAEVIEACTATAVTDPPTDCATGFEGSDAASCTSPGGVDRACTVRSRPGRLSALSVLHSKSILYETFVCARRALNSPKRRFPAWAVHGAVGADCRRDWGQSEKDTKLAQKLGQLQPFTATFPQELMGQLASFGPT
jgi:hypothetical protein